MSIFSLRVIKASSPHSYLIIKIQICLHFNLAAHFVASCIQPPLGINMLKSIAYNLCSLNTESCFYLYASLSC